MRPSLRALQGEYAAALKEYLEHGGEAPLFRAYQLGRNAVSGGLGVLEVAAIHQEALVLDLLQMLAPQANTAIVERAAAFLAEALAPFETNRRGFLEANTLLREINAELERRVGKALEDYQAAQDQLEEQRRIEALKEEFVSMVSHELRTPLTSIHGALGLIEAKLGETLPDDARRLIDVARRNSQRLARLVDNVLDLQKLESGSLSFDVRSLDLLQLLELAVEANQPYAAQFGVSLVLRPVPVDLRVAADPDRVVQVVTNLASNAAKYSPEGEQVIVSAERATSHVRVRVSDCGPGIPESFKSRVFQRFAQADSSSTRARGGSGLGLSISKAIVERLGGAIGFDTGSRGTTFYFDLPLAGDSELDRECHAR